MHFTVFKETSINFPIFPVKDSESFFLVLVIFSFIFSSSWPCIYSLSMHHIVYPVTSVTLFIGMNHSSFPVHLIIAKCSSILRSISPFHFPFSLFFSFKEIPVVYCSITPNFYTLAMIQAIDPLSFK